LQSTAATEFKRAGFLEWQAIGTSLLIGLETGGECATGCDSSTGVDSATGGGSQTRR